MSARLQAWLGREGAIPEAALRAAVDRQRVYGGGLDTAILERGLLTEPALWARLAAVTGLRVPSPTLGDAPPTPPPLDAAITGPLRAVPVARHGQTLDVLCAEPVQTEAIHAAAAAQGFVVRLYVVPEMRLLAARQRVYGEPLPARYAPLLAGALGIKEARRALTAATPSEAAPWEAPRPARPEGPAAWGEPGAAPTPLERVLDLSGALASQGGVEAEIEVEMETSGPSGGGLTDDVSPTGVTEEPTTGSVRLAVMSSAPVDATAAIDAADSAAAGEEGSASESATEALCRRARDAEDKGRPLALRALRQRLTHPATQALLRALREEAARTADAGGRATAIRAIDGLAELRDTTIIPILIGHLAAAQDTDELQIAAHRALVALCAQDLGHSQRRWRSWARIHADSPRVEWLLEGLSHKNAAIRADAAEELRQLAGESFGYLADASKRDRELARARFQAWWEALSRPPPPREHLFESADPVPLPPTPKAR